MTRPNKRAATLGYPYRKRQIEVRVRREHKQGNHLTATFMRLAFGAGEAVRAFNRLPARAQANVRAMSRKETE